MAQQHYVIIGNGSAGNKAAQELRKANTMSRISMISAEPTPYLLRHKLAGFLTDKTQLDALAVHGAEWYRDRDIRLRLNQPVVSVNTREKWLILAHREKISYDKLLICSGASPRIPEYLSPFSDMLTLFSQARDALRLKKRLHRIKHLALIGGDCIGLQLISTLLPAGKSITLLMDDYRCWPMEFEDQTREIIAESLASKGVRVIANDYVTAVSREAGTLRIKTFGGDELETDEALVCSGMAPSLGYLSDAGIDLQQGILVNDRLETSVPDIWAAGECAQIYHRSLKDYRLSTGYLNAQVQGEIAARNMVSENKVPSPLPKPGEVTIAGKKFTTYGWKGFSLDEKG